MPLPRLWLAAKGVGAVLKAPMPSSSSTANSISRTGTPKWSESQKANMRIMLATLNQARLPPSLANVKPALALAMIVNSWHESRIDATARALTAKEDSVGLFQVNRLGSLGRPYSPGQLMNPQFNTAVILSEVYRQAPVLGPIAASGTVGQLVAGFCVHVERPANSHAVSLERAAAARRWWGTAVVDARTASLGS